MNFIPVRPLRANAPAARYGASAVLLFAVAVTVFVLAGAAGPFAFLAVGIAFTASFLAWRGYVRREVDLAAVTEQRRDEITRVYGLDIPDGLVRELQFPGSLPGPREQTYGTVFLTRLPWSVRLRWNGEQLVLVDGAGKELPRAGE